MKSSKKWSYKQITEHTEKTITFYMQQAVNLEEHSESRLYLAWATGVYNSWYSLTVGWQNDGDNDRLEALTNFSKFKSL